MPQSRRPLTRLTYKGLLWQLLTGTGPIGLVMSALGSILFGVVLISVNEFIYYASTQAAEHPADVRSIHPPSREQTVEERQGFRTIMDLAGLGTLLGGARTIVIIAQQLKS